MHRSILKLSEEHVASVASASFTPRPLFNIQSQDLELLLPSLLWSPPRSHLGNNRPQAPQTAMPALSISFCKKVGLIRQISKMSLSTFQHCKAFERLVSLPGKSGKNLLSNLSRFLGKVRQL